MTDGVVVLPAAGGAPLDVLTGPGTARAVVGPATGAKHRSMWVLDLEPGTATIELRHPSEAVYYVVWGDGHVLVPAAGEALVLGPGAMVHVEAGAAYTLVADGEALRVVGGPSPPDPGWHGGVAAAAPAARGRVRLFHRDKPSAHMPVIAADARLVVWPGVDAHTANMNYVRIAAGEANVAHAHASSEDTIVILSGRGTVEDLTHGVTQPFETGDVIHVPPAVEHRVRADRGEAVSSCGGPCPPDPAMLRLAEPIDDAATRR